jgi:DNA-directed RNA polymerase
MNLRETQEALEQQWLDTGCLKYKHVYSTVNFSDTQVGSYIFGKILSDLEAAIKEFLKTENLRTDYQRAVFLCLTPLDIATLTLKNLMDVCFSGVAGFRTAKRSNCISSLSITIGQRLISHFNFVTLRKKNPKAYDHMIEFLNGKSKATRYNTLRWYKKTMLEREIVAPPDALASIGYPLLRMAIETSGLFEVIPKIVGKHTIQAVVPTPEVINSVMSNINRLAAMHPVYLPMVVPPEPWTSWDQGGYLTMPTLAITHHRDVAKRLFDSGHLQPRLETLNRLGSVPWEINKEILEIQLEAYNCNHRSVPVSDVGVALPEKPWKSNEEYRALEVTRPDLIKQWKQSAGRIYTEFFTKRCIGQRLAFLRNLSIARKFESYDAIWFPYRMDYRGRCYSIASGLSPQGNDFARSLLRFHQKTPLSPNDGEAWGWYLVQGANLMGVDKVPFPERQAFVRKNHENILASARDPLNNQWWLNADKPWVMLAWCLEYTAIVTGQQSYTQLPVNRDGRCNGLQHLAAAVRDRDTAELVSLVPMDKPSDIYTKVLEAVNRIIPEDSFWHGKVNRKLVKRNTMTTPLIRRCINHVNSGDTLYGLS